MHLNNAAPAIRRRVVALVTMVATVVVLLAVSASGRAADGGLTRLGRESPRPAGASVLGTLPNATAVSAAVTLRPRDPAALATYARAVSTPGSGSYHRYLTVAQFAQRYGPTVAQIAAVRASLRARGLMPGTPAADGLSVPVTASAGSLANAFSTTLERYRLTGGRTAFANTAAPSVPTGIAPFVQGVVGLSSLAVQAPLGLVSADAPATASPAGAANQAAAPGDAAATGETAPCSGASNQASNGGYTADQISSAYGFSGLYGAGDSGSGTRVALFELEPYSSGDVAAYQACYGTTASVTTEAVDGGAGTGTGAGEAALDIEDVIGLAPTAGIRVYEGPNTQVGVYDTYSRIINDNSTQVISTSWGECEADAGSAAANGENTLFQEAATQGQSVFAASGDTGAQGCGGTTSTPAVEDPASQPYVTGVGGTSLPSTSGGETVWDNAYGAGGGGVSTLWPAPSYQTGVAEPQSPSACGSSGSSCREVPDVSADADPNTGYVIYYNGSWNTFGGTSAAAPTWAALTALADASSTCDGTDVGFANSVLYRAAANNYAGYFNDVTAGDNSFDGVTGFSAGTGYDLASGLGTPRGSALASSMCGVQVAGDPTTTTTPPPTATPTTGAPPPTAPPRTISPPTSPSVVTLSTPAAHTGRVRLSDQLRLHAVDSGGLALTYAAKGLPAGLSINAGSGLISGRPTRAGQANVTVTAADSRGSSALVVFDWTIEGRPSATSSLRLAGGARPVLTLQASAGPYARAIRSIVVSAPHGTIGFSSRALSSVRGRGLAETRSGGRLKVAVRVARGALVVTLPGPAIREAVLRLSAPQLSLTGRLTATRAGRDTSLRLTVTVTDATGVRTTLQVPITGL